MDDCIFCKIAKGEIECSKIYEDQNVLAFLDINPKAPGHTLIIPKRHYKNIFDIEDKDMIEIGKTVKMLSNKIKDRLNPDGIYIRQNNGELAGQSVFHYHVHIVPCYEKEPTGNNIQEILTD